MDYSDLISRLIKDPSVLFIGQSIHIADGLEDMFLKSIVEKYSVKSSQTGYSKIFDMGSVNSESFRSWCQKLSDNLSVPKSLSIIGNFPWNHIYTSSFDPRVTRAFKNDFRTLQPVFETSYKMSDPRSRTNLNQTLIFGQIQFNEPDRATPLTKLALTQKKNSSIVFLNRLPSEIVTPKGILLIDYWDLADWITPEDLYGVLSKFGEGQVHLFSCRSEIRENEFVADLITKKIIINYETSLSAIIDEAFRNQYFNIPEILQDKSGSFIEIGQSRIKIPESLNKKIKKVALIVNEDIFISPRAINEAIQGIDFRNFISHSATIPRWDGYAKGYAFEREFITGLKEKIIRNITGSLNEYPIIIHGQASSGKTIGIGQTIYDLVSNKDLKIGILYIEKSYRRFSENDMRILDEYCLWVEENGADRVIIFYDGLFPVDYYIQLQKNLVSRGRKVLIVGSTYLLSGEFRYHQEKLIEVPIKLTTDEQKRFKSYLGSFIKEKSIIELITRNQNESNFLAMLYHYLPDSKSTINHLIRNEASYYSKYIEDYKDETYNDPESEGLILKALLTQLGFKESSNLASSEEMLVGGEMVGIATLFINLVMSIGKLGFQVPFEILLRALGTRSLNANFFKRIPDTDFIRWFEDHNGNIMVGPRTTLEARIYSSSLGGLHTENEYIKQILSQVRNSEFIGYEDIEIEFAIMLLQKLKEPESPFRKYLCEYAFILADLRTSGDAYHSRLMLQEASLLQESIKSKETRNNPEFDTIEILETAEEVVNEALRIEGSSSSPLSGYLKVELASIIGSRGTQIASNNPEEAIALLEEAREHILGTTIGSTNYYGLDVLFWTIRNQSNLLVDDNQRLKLYAEFSHYVQFAEDEGIHPAYKIEFERRKQELGQIFKDTVLTEEAFKRLNEMGSRAGYYLKAKGILNKTELSNSETFGHDDFDRIGRALSFLQEHFETIKSDSQCIYLTLKLWWLLKTKHPLFHKERTVLKFNESEWGYLWRLVTTLINTSEIYLLPSLMYLKAISEFHSGDFQTAFATFSELSRMTDQASIGSRRIRKYYLYSDEHGRPILNNGILDDLIDSRQVRGWVSSINLGRKIRIFYSDFRRTFKRGEAVDFYIAFNYIGPTAIPIK